MALPPHLLPTQGGLWSPETEKKRLSHLYSLAMSNARSVEPAGASDLLMGSIRARRRWQERIEAEESEENEEEEECEEEEEEEEEEEVQSEAESVHRTPPPVVVKTMPHDSQELLDLFRQQLLEKEKECVRLASERAEARTALIDTQEELRKMGLQVSALSDEVSRLQTQLQSTRIGGAK